MKLSKAFTFQMLKIKNIRKPTRLATMMGVKEGVDAVSISPHFCNKSFKGSAPTMN
jgi:hypothetical protein